MAGPRSLSATAPPRGHASPRCSPGRGGTARRQRSARHTAIVPRFRNFVAIDWSGAAGERHRGIAVALCTAGRGAPALIRPDHVWSRGEVLDWLLADLPPETLVGIDLGFALPFADTGAYFPGWPDSPPDARALWALVDRISADNAHFGVASVVDHADLARHYRRHGGRAGDLFTPGRGRLRVTEEAQRRAGLNPVSNFNLVGAAQVGKASLTGMRVLHRLAGRLPVWPFDPDPGHGAILVEIYTSLAALTAGRPRGRSKMRTGEDLDQALAALASDPVGITGTISDHRSDALLTAASLRHVADDPALWHPAGLTPEIARTEGWTFGVA